MRNKDKIIKYCLYIVLITGLAICIAMLFPQVRQMIIGLAERMLHKKILSSQDWIKILLLDAIGGIFLIAIFGYCLLTASGKMVVHKLRMEIRDSLVEIDWRSFTKPVLIMSGIYLLGIISLIRANFFYNDDIERSISGLRGFYFFSRYVSEFLSIIIHANFRLTDISPLPQLIAILILAVSSVLLVYVLNNKKITITGLLASIPIGLSPYMLECLSYKYDSPYMALSVLASIVPFLFINHQRIFVFFSVISLLIVYMTYQAASGIYLLILLVLCFSDWNHKRKTNYEIFLFLGRAVISFCVATILFKVFIMRPFNATYASNTMLPFPQMLFSILDNFQTYVHTINSDFSFIWKALIGIIFCFFIAKSVCKSARNKIISFLAASFLICMLLFLSFGAYIVLEHPLFEPRSFYGFGVLLAISSIFVVYEFNNIARIFAIALSWSFLVFALSYGNALADQKRYADFRIGILLHDLSALYPEKDKEENKITIQLKNRIGFTPSIRNIAIHDPIIYKLVPQLLPEDRPWFSYIYDLEYFNYSTFSIANVPWKWNIKTGEPYVDFSALNLPVVLKTYYHTIRSDGKRVLIELNDNYQ